MARPQGRRPAVIAFDVVETLFSLNPLGGRLKAAGLAEAALGEWFARFLRDAFALEAAGVYKTFREVASATLGVMLTETGQPTSAAAIGTMLQAILRAASPSRRPAHVREPPRRGSTDRDAH